MSQKNQNTNQQLNILDLFFYFLSNWYWFALCAVLAVGYAYYRFSKEAFMYRSDATVIIKDPSNTRTAVRLDTYSNTINHVSVDNEIQELTSKQLMTEVMAVTDADFSYTSHIKLRDVELYKQAPVRMYLDREVSRREAFSASVTPQSDTSVLVMFHGLQPDPLSVRLGDTLTVAGIHFRLMPTSYFPSWNGQEVHISKRPAGSAARGYLGRLRISQPTESATILKLSLQDYSVDRASDILNALVNKYNENAIREKNRIAVNTAAFINERLLIIQDELGDVETDLASFKTSEQIMNVNETASRYLSESRAYNDEIIRLEARSTLARYLKDYVESSFDSQVLIPVNTGLDDAKVDAAISEYNSLVLRRDALIKESSESSPAVLKLGDDITRQRSAVLSYIDNLLRSLDIRKEDFASRDKDAVKKFSMMPEKAREMVSIERQQKIKESLYIFLLNKREENALTQAMVDNNARMIDPAEGSYYPIYPSLRKNAMLALLVGLLLPAVVLLAILFLDTKVRTKNDIEENCSLPIIGEVPVYKTKRRKKKEEESPAVAY
ncbi:MAG: chromosome partitioning protein ParA, partial [Bacteroidales bacterium]|nr:chromosome partitioning protein ParA [Bacteroidales bacterium]